VSTNPGEENPGEGSAEAEVKSDDRRSASLKDGLLKGGTWEKEVLLRNG
jgi:hypothetical protein